ncbi:MAG: hypothetical protein HQ596_01070 [Candidatus Saganbacteria bacterium]|nr:hypothetical protein [Candidatus Saganbacteria bacterium]
MPSIVNNMRVVLVNVGGRGTIPVRSSLGLRVIEKALQIHAKVSDIRHFPALAYLPNRDGLAAFNHFGRAFSSLSNGSRNLLFVFSTTTAGYPVFREISRGVKQALPHAARTLGGPHLAREEGLVDTHGRRYRDTVELALQDNLADAAVVGDAAPLIDYVNIGMMAEAVDPATTPGLYYLDHQGNIIGRNTGRFPVLEEIPHIFDEEKGRASLMLTRECENNCGFCRFKGGKLVYPKSQVPIVLQQISARFKEAGAPYGKVQFYDSNPAEERKGGNLITLLDEFEREAFPYLLKIAFLEVPSLLGKDIETFAYHLIQHGFYHFKAARDAVTAKTAVDIGRNFKGRPRSQTRLDDEKTALLEFITALKKWHRDKKTITGYPPVPNFKVSVSYIISPFMTEDEMLAMVTDMEDFEKQSGDGVEIIIRFNPLMPFPGNAVRKEHIEHVHDPEFTNISLSPILWDSSLGPAVEVMNFLMSHRYQWQKEEILQKKGQEAYYRSFREFIRETYANG